MEAQRGRRGDVALEDDGDLSKGMVVISRRVRDNAVAGRENLEVAHIRVVRREEDADVARDAG